MRIIGMDIHRVAADVVVLHEGRFTKLGRVPMLREALEAFAAENPGADRAELTALVAAAVAERRSGQAAGAGRRLFRLVQGLLATG